MERFSEIHCSTHGRQPFPHPRLQNAHSQPDSSGHEGGIVIRKEGADASYLTGTSNTALRHPFYNACESSFSISPDHPGKLIHIVLAHGCSHPARTDTMGSVKDIEKNWFLGDLNIEKAEVYVDQKDLKKRFRVAEDVASW